MNNWIMCEYLNEWGSEWMIGLLREGMNNHDNWVSERIVERRNKWASKSMSDEMREQSSGKRMREIMREWRRVWIHEWRPKLICQWIC